MDSIDKELLGISDKNYANSFYEPCGNNGFFWYSDELAEKIKKERQK